MFESEEKPLLIALPPLPYEVADWVYGRRVQANCHVSYARNWYSAPYPYVGSAVDLRVSTNTLEIWHKGVRLCTHRLLPGAASNRYSTNESDLPGKTMWRQWDRVFMFNVLWAGVAWCFPLDVQLFFRSVVIFVMI